MTILEAGKYRPQVRSRHPSHEVLRTDLPKLPFRSVIRLGSTTELEDSVTSGGSRIELNTVKSVKNSSDKYMMKRLFKESGITNIAKDVCIEEIHNMINNNEEVTLDMEFPLIAKKRFGSRGEGMILINNEDQLEEFINQHTTNYLIEEYCNYSREYRIHMFAELGCVYTNRKMLKSDVPEEERYYRNDTNCVWFLETNEKFKKPRNWQEILTECDKARKAIGLDFCAIDIKISGKNETNGKQKFIILETNSAPSFGDGTAKQYIDNLPKLLIWKKGQ